MNHNPLHDYTIVLYNHSCLFFTTMQNFIEKLFKYIWNVGGIYIIWSTLHYMSAQLYSYYCTPQSIIGFFISPFIIATPQCTALRWCIAQGSDTIITMWIVLGTWCSTKLGGYSLK